MVLRVPLRYLIQEPDKMLSCCIIRSIVKKLRFWFDEKKNLRRTGSEAHSTKVYALDAHGNEPRSGVITIHRRDLRFIGRMGL